MISSSKFIWTFCSICKCLQCQPDFIEPWWAQQRKDEHVLSLTWLRLETSCTAKHASWTSVSSTKAGWHLHWLARKKIRFEQNGSKWQVSTNDFTFSMRDSCLRFETSRCCWLLEIISCKCLWQWLFFPWRLRMIAIALSAATPHSKEPHLVLMGSRFEWVNVISCSSNCLHLPPDVVDTL